MGDYDLAGSAGKALVGHRCGWNQSCGTTTSIISHAGSAPSPSSYGLGLCSRLVPRASEEKSCEPERRGASPIRTIGWAPLEMLGTGIIEANCCVPSKRSSASALALSLPLYHSDSAGWTVWQCRSPHRYPDGWAWCDCTQAVTMHFWIALWYKPVWLCLQMSCQPIQKVE